MHGAAEISPSDQQFHLFEGWYQGWTLIALRNMCYRPQTMIIMQRTFTAAHSFTDNKATFHCHATMGSWTQWDRMFLFPSHFSVLVPSFLQQVWCRQPVHHRMARSQHRSGCDESLTSCRSVRSRCLCMLADWQRTKLDRKWNSDFLWVWLVHNSRSNFKELFVALGLSNNLLEFYRHYYTPLYYFVSTSFDYLGDGQAAQVAPLHVTSYSLLGRTLRDSRARWKI